MELLDLFRPKWRNSNSSIRRNSLEKITKQSILAIIALNDEDFKIRELALDLLTDQEQIAKVASETKLLNIFDHAVFGQLNRPAAACPSRNRGHGNPADRSSGSGGGAVCGDALRQVHPRGLSLCGPGSKRTRPSLARSGWRGSSGPMASRK